MMGSRMTENKLNCIEIQMETAFDRQSSALRLLPLAFIQTCALFVSPFFALLQIPEARRLV
jgi:hypothetical protein